MPEKYQWFNGRKFARDENTGYYLNSTLRIRMHRYVWEYHNGAIPKGFDIHHIDGNKANNNIDNLQIISRSEHMSMHMSNIPEERKEAMRLNLEENARPRASEWHKSPDGRAWHKKHLEDMGGRIQNRSVFKCAMCGKEFEAWNTGDNRFCSNSCKSAWRRKSGIDDEDRICPVCGKTFRINKYSRQRACSRSCAHRLAWEKRRRSHADYGQD